MKRSLGIFILFAASLSLAHTVHLNDGSRLEGEVLMLNEQSLILNTQFAGILTLARNSVAAVIFNEDFAVPVIGNAAIPSLPQASNRAVVEGSGILEVVVQGSPAKSSVRYRVDSEREAMAELNALHMRVFMDGKEVAHAVDPDMDKEFRKGNWLVMRNSHRFEPLRVELPVGVHRLQIVISNDVGAVPNAGNHDILSAEVIVEQVDIVEDQLTRVIVKGKSGRLGSYGEYELELLSSR